MKTFGRVLVLLATAAVAALFLVDDSDQDLLFSRVKVATGVEEGLEDGQAMITRRVAVAESAGAACHRGRWLSWSKLADGRPFSAMRSVSLRRPWISSPRIPPSLP
jgi:hypothetical protein